MIARPNEQQVNKWPNEDAQTLIFDDSNLFRVDKFSGWDRVEGGGRTNYGAQYTMQFNQGGVINMLFGQSYQLFGANSFAQGGSPIPASTAASTPGSPTMSRASPTSRTRPTSSSRASASTKTTSPCSAWSSRRAPISTAGRSSALYGDYAAQPDHRLRSTAARASWLPARYKLDANWVLLGGARYDIEADKFDQTRIGLGYVDDCLILALNYITNYTYSGNPVTDHTIMLQLSLRTLGGTSVSQGVGGLGGL